MAYSGAWKQQYVRFTFQFNILLHFYGIFPSRTTANSIWMFVSILLFIFMEKNTSISMRIYVCLSLWYFFIFISFHFILIAICETIVVCFGFEACCAISPNSVVELLEMHSWIERTSRYPIIHIVPLCVWKWICNDNKLRISNNQPAHKYRNMHIQDWRMCVCIALRVCMRSRILFTA